jgi:hypothetical protein
MSVNVDRWNYLRATPQHDHRRDGDEDRQDYINHADAKADGRKF